MNTPLIDLLGGSFEPDDPHRTDELISEVSVPIINEEYISPFEMARLYDVSRLALQRNGADAQFEHLIEEMGELIVAKSRRWRNRSTDEDILEEIVDVFQCVVQMGVHHYGKDAFNAMFQKKKQQVHRQDDERCYGKEGGDAKLEVNKRQKGCVIWKHTNPFESATRPPVNGGMVVCINHSSQISHTRGEIKVCWRKDATSILLDAILENTMICRVS